MPARYLRFAAAALLLVLAPRHVSCADAPAAQPVSVQQISLLLRSGYTGDEMLKETANRPLLAPIDAAAERALLDAGADARTIAALRDGRRVASQDEAAEVQRRQAAAEQYRLDAWEADQARRAEAGREAMKTKLAARREEELKKVATSLRDKLVACKNDRVEPYDSAALANKKLFLLYSAGSDKASRQLTPQLVDFYKKFAPAHPEFEVVLLSTDRSAADMERSMKQAAMPWPALAFEQLAQQTELAALGREAAPRLVLIDGSATKIADTVENGKILSPQRVIDALLAQTGTKQAAK